MRRVCWTPVNQYGDAIFTFINITPPDEEMARHKYLPMQIGKRDSMSAPNVVSRFTNVTGLNQNSVMFFVLSAVMVRTGKMMQMKPDLIPIWATIVMIAETR